MIHGGAGVAGSNLFVSNSGAISGGGSADALLFTGGSNDLTTLTSSATLSGAIRLASAQTSLSLDANSASDTTYANTIVGAGSLIVNAGNHAMTLSGANTFSGGLTVTTGVLNLAVAGAGGTGNIIVNNGAVLNITGGGYNITANANTVVALSNVTNVADVVTVSGDAFGAKTGNGQWAGVFLSTGTYSYVTGANNGINVTTGATLILNGGGNIVYGSAQTELTVENTNRVFDTLYVSNDQLFGATTAGFATGLLLQANVEVNLYGSDDGIDLSGGSVLNASGGGENVYMGAAEVLSVSNTNGVFDNINSSSDAFGGQTANGQWAGIYLQTNVEANVNGSSNGIYVASGAVLNAAGDDNLILATSLTVVNVSMTGNRFDTIDASNDVFGTATANGQWAGIYLQANAAAFVNGSNNGIDVVAGGVLYANGGANTIFGGANTVISVTGTNGAFDTILVSNNVFGLQTFNSQWAGVYLQAGAEVNLSGSNDGINIASGCVLNATGGGNTIYATANTVVNVAGAGAQINKIVVNNDAFGGQTANSQWAGVYIQAGASASVTGSNNGVYLGANSALSINGGGDVILANGHDILTLSANGASAADTLDFYGAGDQVQLNSGVNANIYDYGSSALLQIASNIGTTTITGFAQDTAGIVDLLNGAGGYTSAAQALGALNADGSGGALLSLGSSDSIDIRGVAPGSLSVANFKIN